jgi:sugar (pentulose or hexulose) kinase
MSRKQPVIAIIDIGKTNKKLLLFDEGYQVVSEEIIQFEEISDEDGFPCEDIEALSQWIKNKFQGLNQSKEFDLKAINFSAYGASCVHLNQAGNVLTPLYNYLKPYPDDIKDKFLKNYGTKQQLSIETASPITGHLNLGLQLYWLKYTHNRIFNEIKHSLYFPQYLSYLISGKKYAEITYIGAHSVLWDFQKNDYHTWIHQEGIFSKLPPIRHGNNPVKINIRSQNKQLIVGIGLHDSCAALIPYTLLFDEPFAVISTGTWCISLNPFNHVTPTNDELAHGCLSYLSFDGKPVKASMLFSGNDHHTQVQRIANHFNLSENFYEEVYFDKEVAMNIIKKDKSEMIIKDDQNLNNGVLKSKFQFRDLSEFESAEYAYHQLILDIVNQQKVSTQYVLKDCMVKKLFVDGGFSKNIIYMKFLSNAFPGIEVFSATIAQTSSLGSAMVIHSHWNNNPLSNDFIKMEYYGI